jgi:hypothetical protein
MDQVRAAEKAGRRADDTRAGRDHRRMRLIQLVGLEIERLVASTRSW